MTAAETVVRVLSATRFHYADERELQNGVNDALMLAGIPFERECRLSRSDRPDFFVAGGVAIEIKIKDATNALLRQLRRYASHSEVQHIVVLTTPRFAPDIPSQINGKTVRTVTMMGGVL